MAYYGNQPTVGQNQSFKVLDDISSYTETFDATSTAVVSAANDTLTFYDHRFVQGQRVTYTHGGGAAINGLTTATAYYVIRQDKDTIQLATNATNAANGTAIDISLSGTSGTAHTLNIAFDGTNTKFKATYESGYHVKLTRAAQLQISVNGVVQEPKDGNSPSSGYAIDTNNVIVFSTAPISTDTFWGTFLASNLPSWEIADNKVDNFDGDSSATNFTLSKLPANNENVLVTINGVVQHPSDATTTRAYKLIGQEIVFTNAPLTGEAIQVRHIGFAGAAAGGVTGFYGRTGNVTLTSADDVTINNITGVAATFTGNVSIGGTLTYTDVTNIDAVGIITAQQGIHVGAGATVAILNTTTGISSFTKLNVVGVSTFDGNVGIGTDYARRKLTVYSDEQVVGLISSRHPGNRSFIRMLDPSTTHEAYAPSIGSHGHDLALRTGLIGSENKPRVYVHHLGKVGVGTTNPTTDLQIVGSTASAASSGGTLGIRQKGDSINDGITLTSSHANSARFYKDSDGALHIYNTGGSSDDFVLTNAGKVGIGTDPGTEFHVYDGDSVLVSLFESETHDSRLRIKAPSTKYSQIEFADGDADTGEIRYDHTDDSMQFFVNSNSEKLRINRDGDVLIGTGTTPTADIKLLVAGNGGVSSGSYFSFRGDYGNVPEPAAHAIKYDSTIGAGGGLHCYSYSGMNFNLGGQERIKFDVNGKVLIGVGVTDYGSLNVDGSASFGDNGTNAGIIIGTDGVSGAALHCLTTGSFQNGSYSNMRFNALSHKFTYGNTVRMFIESDGKIGIGTDDPDHNLHLWKYGGDSVLSIESQGNGNHAAIEFLRTSSGGDGKGAGSIYVTGNTGASEAKMQFGVGHNISHGQLPRMTIMGNGEVGIGTDNPLSKLHLADTNTTVWPFASAVTDTYGYTPYPHELVIDNDVRGTEGSFAGIYFNAGADTDGSKVSTARIAAVDTGSYKADLVFSTRGYASGGGGADDHKEHLRIRYDGKVGIGTDVPGAPLHVHSAPGSSVIAIFGSNDPASGATYEALTIKNNVTSYPAIENGSSGDTLDLRSLGSVQATIDSNNNSTGKYFRVMTNGVGDSGTELFKVMDNGITEITEGAVRASATGGGVDTYGSSGSINGTTTHNLEGGFLAHYTARDGTKYRRVFDIASAGDGTWGGQIRFSTHPDGGGTTHERARLTHQGVWSHHPINQTIGYQTRTRIYPYFWDQKNGNVKFSWAFNVGATTPHVYLLNNATQYCAGTVSFSGANRTNWPSSGVARSHNSMWSLIFYGETDNDYHQMRENNKVFENDTDSYKIRIGTNDIDYIHTSHAQYGTNSGQYQDGFNLANWHFNTCSTTPVYQYQQIGVRMEFSSGWNWDGTTEWYVYIDD